VIAVVGGTAIIIIILEDVIAVEVQEHLVEIG
jgi:hypothetical protein